MAEYKKFARPSNSRPGPGNSRPRPFSAGNSQPRELYDAQCSKCQQRCQVPFRPNGKKPVYCANCFVKDDSRDGSSYSDHKSFKQRSASSSSYAPTPQAPDRSIQELKKQMEVMNGSLERLITTMNAFTRSAELSSELRKHVPTSDVVEKKPVKAAKKPAKKATKKASKR